MNTLWTAFFGRDIAHVRSNTSDAPVFHVTHKYLGEQTDIVESQITSLIVDYFSNNPEDKIVPRMEFSKIDYFGENYSRVLCMTNHQFKKYLFMDLRKQLDAFRKDDFPDWRPHITTDSDTSKIFVFDYFALMRNDDVVIKFDI
jgi:hypothetical protein